MQWNPFRRFVDLYVDHVVRTVNARSERVRELQRSSGRSSARIVRYEIYEGDVRRRDVPQNVYPFTVRVTADGRMERLPDGVRPDVTVYSDLATVKGIADGRRVEILRDGTRRTIEPFTVFDALRLDRVEWAGTSETLQDLLLFERRVAPEFLRALQLPKTG